MKQFQIIGLSALMITALFVADVTAAGRGQGKRRGQSGQGRGGQSNSQGRGSKGNSSGAVFSLQLKKSLVAMFEEEKLAHDVYIALGKTSKQRIFLNISQAESRHMNALNNVLKRAGVNVSNKNNQPGVFANPTSQKLYKTLVTAGSKSVLEAFKVGAKVEEMDIDDLRKVKAITTDQNVLFVLNNLERGSRNHLRAFAAGIKQQNGTYQAEFLSQKEFEAIAASQMEKGGQGNRRGNQQGAQRGGQGRGNQQQRSQRGQQRGGKGRGRR